MTQTTLNVNGTSHTVDVDPSDRLVYVLRDDLGLTGTKFGCGMSQCGACAVHVDGKAVRSCVTPVSAVIGKQITTVEGLSQDGKLSTLQQAWLDVGVPQCGYCQSGQMMEASAFLAENPHPTEDEIREAMNGHLCRCGTYNRIIKAIQLAASRS